MEHGTRLVGDGVGVVYIHLWEHETRCEMGVGVEHYSGASLFYLSHDGDGGFWNFTYIHIHSVRKEGFYLLDD